MGLPTIAELFEFTGENDIKCSDIEKVIRNYTYTSPEPEIDRQAYSLRDLGAIYSVVTHRTL